MAAPGTDDAQAKEWAERDRKMNEAATLTGGVGLLHLQHAQGGAAGQFRVGFTTEYFSAGFLCTDTFPCKDPRNANSTIRQDSSDHIGGHRGDTVGPVRYSRQSLSSGIMTRWPPGKRARMPSEIRVERSTGAIVDWNARRFFAS